MDERALERAKSDEASGMSLSGDVEMDAVGEQRADRGAGQGATAPAVRVWRRGAREVSREISWGHVGADASGVGGARRRRRERRERGSVAPGRDAGSHRGVSRGASAAEAITCVGTFVTCGG